MVQRNVNFVKNEKFIESVMFFSETQEDIPEWEKELQAELQVTTFLSETSSLCQERGWDCKFWYATFLPKQFFWVHLEEYMYAAVGNHIAL